MVHEKSMFRFGWMLMLILTIHTQLIVHLKPAPPILMHIQNLLLSMENLTMIALSALKKLQVLMTLGYYDLFIHYSSVLHMDRIFELYDNMWRRIKNKNTNMHWWNLFKSN